MKLKVMDRLMLLNVLPPEGDLITMRIVHGLRQRLSFTEEEFAALDFKKNDDEQKIIWNKEADQEVEIEIGQKAMRIIVDRIEELSKQKKLTESYIPVADKFMGDDE